MPHCQVLRLLDYHIKVSSAAGLKQYSLTFTIFVPQSESQNWSCVNLILHDDKKKKHSALQALIGIKLLYISILGLLKPA